jgi:PhnB protein
MSVKPIPDGYHAITPYLVGHNVAGLIDFLAAAFGAVEIERMTDPAGRIMHAEVRIGDSIVMMGEANEQFPPLPTAIYHYVVDCDATYQRAIAAGGKSLMEPANQFYGDRNAGIEDPSGNKWWIGTHVEDVSRAELERRARERK